MANAISNLLHNNVETIIKYGSGDTLAALDILDTKTMSESKTAINQAISNACSSPEADEYLEALGKTGSAGKDSLSLGTGKVARAAGYKPSAGWQWAMRVNRLAKAMVANLEA